MKKNLKRRIKKGVATALAGITLASPSLAKAKDISGYLNEKPIEQVSNLNLRNRLGHYISDYKPEITIPEIALNSALSYLMTTYMHELGHCAVAKAYGLDVSIDSEITNEKVASYHYNGGEDLSNDQKALLNIGSSITTRTNYEIINHLMKKEKIPEKLEPFASTYALLSRLDMSYQIAIGARNHFFNENNKYLDYESFVDNISKEHDISKDIVYGVLIGAELFDLYLDRKEIKNHFQMALGREVDFNKEKDLDFDLMFDGKKLGFNVNYKF